MVCDMYLMFYVLPSVTFHFIEHVIWDYLIKLLKLLAVRSDFSTNNQSTVEQGKSFTACGVLCIYCIGSANKSRIAQIA